MKATIFPVAIGLLLTACYGPRAEGQTASKDVPGHKPTTAPQVWLCSSKSLELTGADARWDFVKQHLTGIELYIGQLKKGRPDQLRALVKVVKDAKLKVAVECGGTLGFAPLDDTNGEQSARIELAKIDKWYQAGGTVDYLNLDGPVRRLLYPKRGRRRIPGFTSVDRCARELADYMQAVNRRHPEIQFFLLTNFPNWGYRGDVSYHGRGAKQQDWGDYDQVLRTVLKVLKQRGVQVAGITVDNPYEYLVGTHFSVKLKDPKKVHWIRRVRALEQFARQQGLEFNLIVNSEAGGKESDQAFYQRTLQMLDAYMAAGGQPTRYVVQSWYPYPKTIVPEDGSHTLTALVKAVIEKLSAAGNTAGR